MEIIGNSLEELWVRSTLAVVDHGRIVHPRGLKTRELISAKLTLTDPRRRIPALPIRKWSLAYAMGELAWYLAGDDSLDFIQRYAPSYGKFSDDGVRLHGAYGPRIFGTSLAAGDRPVQWLECVALLKRDPDTRQAVMAIFEADDCGVGSKDVPCTLSLQFLIRNGALSLIVNMRSNDLWLGTLYDVFCFTVLQELMANELGVELGVYYHHVGSLHLYEKNYNDAARVLDACRSDPPADIKLPVLKYNTIRTLLDTERGVWEEPPSKLLADLCGPHGALSLWDLAALAWAWKRVSASAEIKEEQRRIAQALLSARLGVLFDRCFY
jgi:thymidylate synthase